MGEYFGSATVVVLHMQTVDKLLMQKGSCLALENQEGPRDLIFRYLGLGSKAR